jgi:hypothetical protein
MSHDDTTSGETLGVAAGLSVTLTASTSPAIADAARRTGSATGFPGGDSSAVTVNLPLASTSRNVMIVANPFAPRWLGRAAL